MSTLSEAIDEATRPEEDDEAYWAAVEGLRKEGPSEAWRLVAPLALDPRPEVRALVPDVMRYFSPHPLRDEVVARLATMLETERGPIVLRSIALAFVDLRHPRAAELLPPLLESADPRVRRAAVHGLLSVPNATPTDCFVRASRDEDDDVRNWATFGLRVLMGEVDDLDARDTPEIRDALVARLDDEVAEAMPAPEADPALAGAALADCLRPLLSTLPETYRSVVHASELEGRSLREIADVQGISVDAAKQPEGDQEADRPNARDRRDRGRRQHRDSPTMSTSHLYSPPKRSRRFGPALCLASRAISLLETRAPSTPSMGHSRSHVNAI